jgi:cell division protease FtsH
MSNSDIPPSKDPQRNGEKSSGVGFWYLLAGGVLIAFSWYWLATQRLGMEISFGEFRSGLKTGQYNSKNVHELKFGHSYVTFQNRPEPAEQELNLWPLRSEQQSSRPQIIRSHVAIGALPESSIARLEDELQEAGITVHGQEPTTEWSAVMTLALMAMTLFALIYFFRRMTGPGTAMSFGRSRGKLFEGEETRVTFDQVAGIDEAVEELREIVEFLKTPAKYQALGGRIPRGVLLVGPPGTGKTLLAKAVAGEAGVPFFSLSGSDFVEMFVGVGAARVRDMFAQALSKAPSIIFIDELDALGKVRGSGMPGGHDERDQTLNALLVEMDGFASDQSVIVMGATNRPETLDPALMRPGRFDRHVLVDRPDFKGREAILKVHSVRVKMADDVDLAKLAKITPGFVGADLEKLCNEAALLAARKNRDAVTMVELEEATERVSIGLEKASRIIKDEEKRRIACHESGHALAACSLPNTDPVHKISIIPRGLGALGYMLQRPEDDKHIITQSELVNDICVLLGGIAAEEAVYQEVGTGARNDLERATYTARRMVTEYGMSPKMGRVNYGDSRRSPFLYGSSSPVDHGHAEQTMREIDLEVKRIIDECMETTREIMRTRRAVLDQITKELIEVEVMDAERLQKILDAHRTGPQLKPGTYIEKLPRDEATESRPENLPAEGSA